MINQVKNFFALFLVLFAASSFAQGPEVPAIKERLVAFMELTNSKDYDAAFDYMYPRMFDLVPKHELVDMMKTMDQNGLSLTVMNPSITSYSEPLIEGNEKFIRIEYVADLKVDIVTGSMFDSPAACDAMKGQFESIYGKENVKWNKEAKRYDVVAKKAMVAIQPDGGEWYLIEIRPDQMDLMKALFSETVIKKFVTVE
jgi:hypothetical protein